MRKLEKLKEWGKSGNYREALKDWYRNSPNNNLGDLLEDVQYAVAFQHRGMYQHALNKYREVINDLGSGNIEIEQTKLLPADIIYNLRLQEVVLLIRLREEETALELIKEMKYPHNIADIEIAKASLFEWYELTQMVLGIVLNDFERIRLSVERSNEYNDNTVLGCFRNLFNEFIEIKQHNILRETETNNICNAIGVMKELDLPGHPWLCLFAGQFLFPYDKKLSLEILEEGLSVALKLGKFYLIAMFMEIIIINKYKYSGKYAQIPIDIGRWINALTICRLEWNKKFTGPIFQFLSNQIEFDENHILQLIQKSTSFFQDPSSIDFRLMCNSKIKDFSGELKAYDVFEKFVADWSQQRFVGELLIMPLNMPTADTIIVREENGIKLATIIQAKFVLNPRAHIPKPPRFIELATYYGFDKVERYVFVVATSKPSGWESKMWYHEDQKKVVELTGHLGIETMILTEIELQSEVLLNHELWYKWFR